MKQFYFIFFIFSLNMFSQTNLDCSAGPINTTYCYTNSDTTQFVFTNTEGLPLNVLFNEGQIEVNFDELIVLDSDGVTNLNEDNPYGNGGNLTGLAFQSSGDTITVMIDSDSVISCQNGNLTEWDWDVWCQSCTNPSVQFYTNSNCENEGEFSINVNITDMGTATSLNINDNQGSPQQNVTTIGIVTFGSYLFNTNVIFTVNDVNDLNCVITSDAISCGSGLFINAGEDVNVECTGNGCVDITASFFESFTTDSYTIEETPYNPPVPFHGLANQLNPNLDDVWSTISDMPINFCFFGNLEAQFQLGTNGVLRFDVDADDPSNDWSFEENLPNNSNPTLGEANVLLPGQDLDPGTYDGDEIGYEVFGDAPNRMLVVSYFAVPHFSCNEIRTFQMVVFYEFSNVIEFYMQDKHICVNWNDGNAALGIQNHDGDIAFVPPGRNTSDSPWTAEDEAWRFTPSGATATYVFEWLDEEGNFISNNPTINVCVTEATTYTAKVTHTNCNGDEVVLTDTVTVSVLGNPQPVTPTPLSICDDTSNDGFAGFVLTDKDDEIIGGESDVFVLYFETLVDAELGDISNAIASPYVNIVPYFQTVFVRVENATTGCFTTVELNLIVNNTPFAPAITDYVLLDDNNDGIEVFDLTTKEDEILNGQTETTLTFYETQNDSNNNTNPIVNPEAYTNTSNPQTIYVRLENFSTFCYSSNGSFIIFADSDLGVGDNLLDDIVIYPNPASNLINIQSSLLVSETQITIFDVQGKKVFSEVKIPVSGKIEMSTNQLSKGLYFIGLQIEKKFLHKKLIIK